MARAAQLVKGGAGLPAHQGSSPLSQLPRKRPLIQQQGLTPVVRLTPISQMRRGSDGMRGGARLAVRHPAYLGEKVPAGGWTVVLILHAGIDLSVLALQGLQETA